MTLALDFDGVIHRYSLGWHDGTIYDPPMPGAVESITTLMEHVSVFIHTTREPEQVMPWLENLGFDVTIDERCGVCATVGPSADCPLCEGSGLLHFWSERGQLLVTNRKLPALAYLDDRAVHFTDWDNALLKLAVVMGRPLSPGAGTL